MPIQYNTCKCISILIHTYPKVFPVFDLIIESITRTGSVDHLSMPL